ncbi:MAG: 4Fe-4S binding protein [Balneolaceae bacterium]|nr:4Fe-4S binding protein [Balneolaceae bacterium]
MALMITERCINCGYCLRECPNSAIYEPLCAWSVGEGTELDGTCKLQNGIEVDSVEWLPPLSENYYYIVPEKCAECEGLFDNPQCVEVCPDPDCIIIHPMHDETEEALLDKQSRLNRPAAV